MDFRERQTALRVVAADDLAVKLHRPRSALGTLAAGIPAGEQLVAQIQERYKVAAVPGIAFGNDKAIRISYCTTLDVYKRQDLSRIMWPFIGFASLSALIMGALNMVGVFGLPMLASAAFNVTRCV